jgi:Protein of unknown function (DUF2877)
MSALTVQVSRWSQAAANLLPPQQEVLGWVHSCYARIINLCTPGGRLLTLQGEGMLQAPLGLALATDVAALGTCLPVGVLVVQDIPTARRSPAALRLRCADALVWDGQVVTRPELTPSGLAGMAQGLAAWLCRHTPKRGLTPILLALEHGHGPMGLSATNAATYTALAPLWAGRQAFAISTLLTLVKALVGLGEGLTPSGDDFLVGLLAVLHVTGFLPGRAVASVHEQFCECVRLGTSQLSGEFLRCAFEGHFAEPLVMLVSGLCASASDAWPAHAATLATVGHSSGVDAMVGIALGCWLLA